jgi:hypothetical protein
MDQLEMYAAVVEGDEVDVLVVELPAGSMVLLTRRVGEPQRIRTAQLVTPKFEVQPVTLDVIEDFLFDRR